MNDDWAQKQSEFLKTLCPHGDSKAGCKACAAADVYSPETYTREYWEQKKAELQAELGRCRVVALNAIELAQGVGGWWTCACGEANRDDGAPKFCGFCGKQRPA